MGNKKEVWLTTVDNPWDPFTQWDRWYEYDEKSGYRTCERIAKYARTSSNLTDIEYENAVAGAIVSILNVYDPYEVYQLAIEGSTQPWGRFKS